MKFFVKNAHSGRPKSRCRDWRRDSREAPSGEWVPDDMPVHSGFWENYRGRLLVCASAFVFGGLFATGAVLAPSLSGGALYLAVLAAGLALVPASVLPVYWYFSYRRLRARYRSVLEEEEEFEQSDDERSGQPRRISSSGGGAETRTGLEVEAGRRTSSEIEA